MSTEKYYNMYQKLLYAESVQKGRIVRNAKRYTKSQNLLRRNTPHPLWWNVLNSMVLQKTQSQVDAAKPCALSSAKQPLHNRGVTFSPSAHYNSRSWTFELYQNTAIQWIIPSDSRVKEFSKRNYTTPFSLTAYSPSIKTDTPCSRSAASEDASLSTAAYQRNIRLRYHYPDRIRPFGRGPQGLQSIQTRPTLISSVTLLRSSYSRLPARKILSWWRIHRVRKEKVHRRRSGQITFLYIQDKDTRRLQVVRPRDSSFSRREQDKLCYRSQSQPAHSAHPWRTSLSRVQERLGGSRIQIPTSPIYVSPLYRGTKASAGEERWPTYALYHKDPCLSCNSHESRASSRERLEVLSGSSQNRAKYQRAEVGLLSFKNTYKEIFGKYGVFPFAFIRLQYNKLVQTAMSAGTISIRYVTNRSQRIFSTASAIGKIWQQKLAPTAETLCLQLGVRLCN